MLVLMHENIVERIVITGRRRYETGHACVPVNNDRSENIRIQGEKRWDFLKCADLSGGNRSSILAKRAGSWAWYCRLYSSRV
jgi:hypothetical protein